MRTSYLIPFTSTTGDSYEQINRTIGMGVVAALEIGPRSEIDSVLVSGHNFTDEPLSVGCGIVGPLTGPLTFRGHPYTAQSNNVTRLRTPFLEIVSHNFYPNTWMQKRGPLGYSVVVPLTTNNFVSYEEVPVYGRKGGTIWISNSGGNSIDYQLLGYKYLDQAGGNPFSTTLVAATAIGAGVTIAKKWSDEYLDTIMIQLRATVAAAQSAALIKSVVHD